jgi:alkanesulfonate monooxygenase SsuD/methylene tetrahydromethanopterin reductase-like flavin-dependent oxidoreductase (luciferase family)
MTTGIVVKPDPAAANAVDDAISQASGAFHRGVRQVWLNQRFDVDALTLAAVIATAVPGLGVGTAVVPINPRHPLLVASAAQTAQAAAHGNFSLGIGLGGNGLEQRAFGIPAGKEVTRLREYLTVLRSIRDDGEVDFGGQELVARPPLSPAVTGGRPFPSMSPRWGRARCAPPVNLPTAP